jgi:pimeloyl-ACP methyl ester carboxylesterase
MQARHKLALALSSLLLAACSSSSNAPRAVPAPPALNDDGSPVTAVITAVFNPSAQQVPRPINLLLAGTRDLTLNIPVANPNNFGDPIVALNTLDGWSTVAPWSFSLSTTPRANTLVGGASIRMFEVTLTGPGGAVTGVVRELASPAEFVVAQASSDATGRTIAVVPTRALKQLTSYMVVVTDDVRDQAGNDATPDQTYFLTQRTSPLCVNGVSTDPLIANAQACALEPLRLLTNAQEAAAASRGIPRSEIVLSWVATTQSITPVLSAVQQISTARNATLANTGLTTAAVGLPPVADIYIGILPLPYYLSAPGVGGNPPTAVLTGFWRAAPGAYVPPFNQAGLDPTSTNITFANPIPVATTTVTVPVLLTIPNANSGRTKPAAGWPIVIFNHGITRNRTDALAISATFAARGFAVIAIDQPLHGVGPTGSTAPFYIENTPFGAAASERTFDVDLINNSTGAAGPDGVIDTSGAHYINLASLLTSRDNLRQSQADLIVLAKSIPLFSYDGDAVADFDGSRISFVGQSLGAITGTAFVAVEPSVNVAVLNVPGGGIAQLLNGSPTFGPRIRAGLAAAGIQAGTPTFDQFLGAAQQAVDAADPINWTSVTANNSVLAQLVVGNGTTVPPDQVVPITVAGAPLSGGEPLVRQMGLASITATTQNAAGIRGVVRFIAGDHGSLLSPAASPAATAEMQGEMASMVGSVGTAVQVSNTSVIRTQ